MTISSQSLADSTELFSIDNTTSFSIANLKMLLPDTETALFFAKVYEFDYTKLSELLRLVCASDVVEALTRGDHSTELQSYIVDTIPEDVLEMAAPQYVDAPPTGQVLPELWASFHTDIAKSIKEVAQKLKHTIGAMPGRTGQMHFQHMAKLNKQRPTIGTYGAAIQHQHEADNLIILDDSGSMSEHTVRTIIEDVVGLAYMAKAHLVLVSNTARHWEPGSYDVKSVLAHAEYQWTMYDQLVPILNRDWGTVVTIADYDSSLSAKQAVAKATGHIDQVLDISLVNRPTFLSECVGQNADEVRPLLVGSSRYILN